jgi:hypothetical protein
VRASNPLGTFVPSHEVTDIFTTALPMRCIDNRKARWGTGEIGGSDAQRRFFPQEKNRSPRRNGLAWPLPRYVNVKGGNRTRFFLSRSIRNLHHQRRSRRETRPNRKYETNSVAALNDAPPSRTPEGSLCHRYPASASFPPTGPALLSPRHCGASPGIRVSRSGLRRENFKRAVAFGK